MFSFCHSILGVCELGGMPLNWLWMRNGRMDWKLGCRVDLPTMDFLPWPKLDCG